MPGNGSLNGGQWAQLEAAVRRWAEDGVVKNARMITGGFFYDPAEDDPSTADGVVIFEQIGDGAVAVPTHVFKIVVGEGDGGALKAIALVAENKKPSSMAGGFLTASWRSIGSSGAPGSTLCRN